MSHAQCSKAVLPLWTLFAICVSCFLCHTVLSFPGSLGKGLAPWLSCVWCFLVVFSLSHMVSWVRCGTWLYRFLIFAFFLTLSCHVCKRPLSRYEDTEGLDEPAHLQRTNHDLPSTSLWALSYRINIETMQPWIAYGHQSQNNLSHANNKGADQLQSDQQLCY